MRDQDKTKEQLISEMEALRRQVAESGTSQRHPGNGHEIAERRRAEAALRESGERFRKVFEEGPIGVALVGLDARIQHVNQRFCEMLGYSEEEIIARGINGITHADDYKSDYLLGMSLLRGEIPSYTIEKRYVRKDKQVIWVGLTTSMMHDEAGKPSLVIGMIEDITERKQAEEALRASETKYRRLYQSMMDAFVSVDMEGHIREYNEAYRTMIGYEPEELLELRYQDLTPEKWHSYEAEIVQKQVLPLGHSDIYEKEYRRKDGTIFPVELRTVLIKDDHDQPCAMWAIVRDITERKRAEAALRESEERFKLFMDNSPAIAWMKDEQGRYVYFSKSYEKRIGVRLDNCQGKTDCELWPGETAEHFRKNDQAVLTSGQVVEVIEETVDSVGDHCYWWTFKFPFQDTAGKRYVAGVGIEITKRKRAEAALQKAHDELEQRVKERTAELENANKQLQHEVEQRRQAEDALRASELRLRQAMLIGKSYAFEWDAITDQAIRSPERAAILGLTGDDVAYGSGEKFFRCIPPADLARLHNSVASLTSALDTYIVNYCFTRRDGTIATLEEGRNQRSR